MYYLEANHIVKQYASHRALDNVTVHVPENGIYGLLGPNGAGKTTLIRIINQITAPDEGEVLIKGRPLHPSDVELAEQIRHKRLGKEKNRRALKRYATEDTIYHYRYA